MVGGFEQFLTLPSSITVQLQPAPLYLLYLGALGQVICHWTVCSGQ